MIYLEDIQETVRHAYIALAEAQYQISVKEPVSGDTVYFDKIYTLSTKIVANLEYLNLMELGITATQNNKIESIIYSLKEIISKLYTEWH